MTADILSSSSGRWSLSLLLFATVFGIYLLFSPSHFMTTPDEELNMRTTLSLLAGQRGAIPPIFGGFATQRGIDGREYAQYGLGLPLFSALWCRLGLWLDPSEYTVLNSIEQLDESTPAGTPFLRWWMTVQGMGISALTAVLCHALFLQIGLSARRAVFCALLFAFGTYQWPHGRTFFTEPLVALCLTGAVWALLIAKASGSLRALFFSASLWAFAILVRVDTLATLPAALWFFLTDGDNHRIQFRMEPNRLIAVALPFALSVGCIALYNQFRFDSFFSTGYEDQAEQVKFATPLLVGLHGFFFTPGRSLFLFSPPLIFAVPGILLLWRNNRWFCTGLLLLCGSFLCAMSKWQNWAGGYDWGPRHIFQITPLLMLFAAACLRDLSFRHPAERLAMFFGIALAVFIQFLGLSADAVTVTREWLANPGVLVDVSEAIRMQFQIYLPQFSIPVLHGKWIAQFGPDLLLFRTLGFSLWILLAYSCFAAAVLFCFRALIKKS